MGFSRKRAGRDGRTRWTAYYLDVAQRERSAGTFSTRRDADHAWQRVEVNAAAGRAGDPRRGRMTFGEYVEKSWFPNHVLEPSTRQSYHYVISKHLTPTFGRMRMNEIMPAQVREWVAASTRAGVSPAGIRQSKIVLSAIFITALNDRVIELHPCRGVKAPIVAVKEFRILTPEEFDRLRAALPCPVSRLLVEVLVESGLRWGELTELRVRDLHRPSGIVTVSRGVVQVDPKFHPDGERFAVKPYPKGRRSRRFKLSPSVLAELWGHVEEHDLGPDDLLLGLNLSAPPVRRRVTLVDAAALGMTEPNERGNSYRHGTTSAYTAGRCRCTHCRGAFADYRARRRADGLDSPRHPRARNSDGHVPAQWFREQYWKPACASSGIDPPVRLHDLRHSHASWLLAGGADLQVVKERLGHRSIATTENTCTRCPMRTRRHWRRSTVSVCASPRPADRVVVRAGGPPHVACRCGLRRR